MSLPKRPKRGCRTTSARKQWQRFIEKFAALKTEESFDMRVVRQEFQKLLARCRSLQTMEHEVKLKGSHRGADLAEEFFIRTDDLKENPPVRSANPIARYPDSATHV